MFGAKRSAGITLEINLRNPFHAGEESYKQGIHSGFEIQGRCHQKSVTGVSMVIKRTDFLQKLFKERKEKHFLFKI